MGLEGNNVSLFQNVNEEKVLESKTVISQGNRFRHGRMVRTASIGSSNNFERVYLVKRYLFSGSIFRGFASKVETNLASIF
jgi:hypothetical protein